MVRADNGGEGGILALMAVVSPWKRGRTIVWKRLATNTTSMADFVNLVAERFLTRVPGTAVFMSGYARAAPPMLLRHLRCNQVLHERVTQLGIEIEL